MVTGEFSESEGGRRRVLGWARPSPNSSWEGIRFTQHVRATPLSNGGDGLSASTGFGRCEQSDCMGAHSKACCVPPASLRLLPS
eukprot:4533517-Prymnesium_polylepis.1